MTISHQKLVGDDGQPTAAVIPWKTFLEMQQIVEGENEVSQMIKSRVESIKNGTAKLIPNEEAMASIHLNLQKRRKANA